MKKVRAQEVLSKIIDNLVNQQLKNRLNEYH
jgi:hypothetical protein